MYLFYEIIEYKPITLGPHLPKMILFGHYNSLSRGPLNQEGLLIIKCNLEEFGP